MNLKSVPKGGSSLRWQLVGCDRKASQALHRTETDFVGNIAVPIREYGCHECFAHKAR